MLEIGIGSVENGQMGGVLHLGYKTGNSLKCWSEYFYNAKIYGIDIYQHNELNNERIRTFVADQSSTHNLQSVMDAIKSPLDIIIDDGSHDGQHQAFSFMYLNSFLSTKGIYIIEDIQPDNILKFQTLSIFPPEFRSYLNDNFTIQYFDTREKHNKTDDFMAVFKRK
jgi:demethylmacrocin O-methyltransferase